jgi:hypothetical protein
VVLKFFIDESYNDRTFNYGGWLAEEQEWTRIGNQWSRRIEYERRMHGKLDRYHASDCASRQNEYDGWSLDQQILHTKKLQAIISRRPERITAICSGVDLIALPKVFTANAKDPLAAAYNLMLRHLMMGVYRVVRKKVGNRVVVIHDTAPGYNGIIRDAFDKLLAELGPRYRELFVTITPLRWQDCVQLQCADMIAFDTFKLLDKTLHASSAKMRRSLQNLVGKGVHVEARYFGERVMRTLLRIHERRERTGETVQQALAADDAEFGKLKK